MKDDKSGHDPIVAVLIEAGERLRRCESFVMATVISSTGSTPRKVGARMLVDLSGAVFGSVGGGAVERIALEMVEAVFSQGKIEVISLNLNDPDRLDTGSVCGGSMEILVEPFGVGPRLLLFGAGHVAQPTAKLAQELGFSVIVHDSRREWAKEERFPNATVKVGDLETLADQLTVTPSDFIVVMTHGHSEDFKVARRLLRAPYYFLGMIGSPRKAIEIRKSLLEEGFSEQEISRLTCPIGIEIGSHTPVEIAVSIAAQLISQRNAWERGKNDSSA